MNALSRARTMLFVSAAILIAVGIVMPSNSTAWFVVAAMTTLRLQERGGGELLVAST